MVKASMVCVYFIIHVPDKRLILFFIFIARMLLINTNREKDAVIAAAPVLC